MFPLTRMIVSACRKVGFEKQVYRNMGLLVHKSKDFVQLPVWNQVFNKFGRCPSYCQIHTSGDSALAEFLETEIRNEQNSAKNEDKDERTLQGFTLEKCENCDITFSRRSNNEIIKVVFNVNDSIYDDEDYNNENSEELKLMSKPPFLVDISKDDKVSLQIQCTFPDSADDLVESEEDTKHDDVILISEVSFKSHSQPSDETGYVLAGNIMDPNLYDMLLNMLEERGIDGNFVDSLIDFSTRHEQRMYIQFLENLKDFASSD